MSRRHRALGSKNGITPQWEPGSQVGRMFGISLDENRTPWAERCSTTIGSRRSTAASGRSGRPVVASVVVLALVANDNGIY
jgi:hypothetical protein